MRRGYLFLLALLSCVAAIPAHAQIVPQTAAAALRPLAVEGVTTLAR